MKTYRISVKEVEVWDRDYYVKAKDEREAKKLLFKGSFDDSEGETTNTIIEIVDIGVYTEWLKYPTSILNTTMNLS